MKSDQIAKHLKPWSLQQVVSYVYSKINWQAMQQIDYRVVEHQYFLPETII